MKNPRKQVVSSSYAARSSAGGMAASEGFSLRNKPSPEVFEMLSRLHESKEFTVANALQDFAAVAVES